MRDGTVSAMDDEHARLWVVVRQLQKQVATLEKVVWDFKGEFYHHAPREPPAPDYSDEERT